MCNLYSETKGHAAIRALFRTANDRTGNLPAFPAISPDQMAPILRNSGARAAPLFYVIGFGAVTEAPLAQAMALERGAAA
jgi:putative SOS response-associated peptidase YedK